MALHVAYTYVIYEQNLTSEMHLCKMVVGQISFAIKITVDDSMSVKSDEGMGNGANNALTIYILRLSFITGSIREYWS